MAPALMSSHSVIWPFLLDCRYGGKFMVYVWGGGHKVGYRDLERATLFDAVFK